MVLLLHAHEQRARARRYGWNANLILSIVYTSALMAIIPAVLTTGNHSPSSSGSTYVPIYVGSTYYPPSSTGSSYRASQYSPVGSSRASPSSYNSARVVLVDLTEAGICEHCCRCLRRVTFTRAG